MNVTKEIMQALLEKVPEGTTIGALDYGNHLMEFDAVKRILLLQRTGEKPVLVFNAMGTHYFNLVEKENFKIIGFWDDEAKVFEEGIPKW